MNIGFIGAGNMAYALAKSIKNSFKHYNIYFTDISQERIELFKNDINQNGFCDTPEMIVQNSDIIFICVKPQTLEKVLEAYKSADKTFVSIVAGVKISKLQRLLPNAKIVRVMPNTPCFYSEMAAGVCGSENVATAEFDAIINMLNSAGVVVRANEESFDAITGLSGSGPAFVARLIEAFAQAGEKVGLSKDVSYKLALQTFKGTAIMLQNSNMSPAELVKMVSSPGGTTIAGREVLESSDYKKVLEDTVIAATKRSEELGK